MGLLYIRPQTWTVPTPCSSGRPSQKGCGGGRPVCPGSLASATPAGGACLRDEEVRFLLGGAPTHALLAALLAPLRATRWRPQHILLGCFTGGALLPTVQGCCVTSSTPLSGLLGSQWPGCGPGRALGQLWAL